MELLDALCHRRSIRSFDPQHRLTETELKHLIGHAQLAPTSFNMQNWHFVAVVDPAVKEQLWLASWKQNPVRDASVVVVITGDLGAPQRSERFLRHAPPPVAQRIDGYVQALYAENPQLSRDEACRSAGFAGMAMMLVAKEMGLDTCPMIGFDPVKVSEALGLDADHPPLLMMTVGKALAPAFPRTGFLDFNETVSVDRFGNHCFAGEPPAA
ncbi:MAG: nitroreductase family protein [Planctomycetota bacterium]|nr:nitroreductase family protein [Planctomycetota bacterium]